jgi:nitrogen fixation NifU-like protein
MLEDAVAFAGVSKYPARVKCALLAWMAWRDAAEKAQWDATEKAGGTRPSKPEEN